MEWISTKDKLPERIPNKEYSQVPCLVLRKATSSHIEILVFNHEHMCWDDESGDDFDCDISDIEFWMPLPERPKS